MNRTEFNESYNGKKKQPLSMLVVAIFQRNALYARERIHFAGIFKHKQKKIFWRRNK